MRFIFTFILISFITFPAYAGKCPDLIKRILDGISDSAGGKEKFYKSLEIRDYSHPLLREYSHEYIDRVIEVSASINEWQKYELVHYFFRNLKHFSSKVKKLPKLGNTKRKVFSSSLEVTYDPRVSELYWYGYPEIATKDVKLFERYTREFSTNSIVTSPYKNGGLDGGYDVESLLEVSKSNGGNRKYQKYLNSINAREGHAVQDFIFSHSTPENRWLTDENFLIFNEMPKVLGSKSSGGQRRVEYFSESTRKFWSIELDDANQAGVHYAPFVDKNGKLVYPMHYFKNNQFVLNNFAPSTWDHHFYSLGYWLSKGVSILRMDAVFFMATREQSDSIGDPASKKMAELIQLFVQALRPNTRVINEAVGGLETAYKYIGKSVNVGNQRMAKMANMDYAFEISNNLRFSMLLGDFEGLHRVINRVKTLEYPEDYFSLLITASHDHEAQAFMPEHQWKKIREMVSQRGGIANYSEFNSVIRNADLFKRDPSGPVDSKRMKMMFKAFLGLGNTAIYYGDEFGKQTEIVNAYSKALEQLEFRMSKLADRGAKLKKISESNREHTEEFARYLKSEYALLAQESSVLELARVEFNKVKLSKPPEQNGPLMKSVFDPRWAKRGDVSVEKMESLLKGVAPAREQEIFNSLRSLKKIRESSPVLFLKHEIDWLDTFDKSVGSWIAHNEYGKVAVFVNPNSEEKWVHVPEIKFEGLKMVELESNLKINHHIENGMVSICIPPDEVLWMK